MRTHVFLLATSLCVWGCSSQTVIHLHPEAIPQAVAHDITRDLEGAGFLVEIEDNKAPASGNTIIYSPHADIEEHLAAITVTLEDYSLFVDQVFVRGHGGRAGAPTGKHVYTEGHIGVYLADKESASAQPRGARIRTTFPFSMVGYEFSSRDCDSDYLYEFYASGEAIITNLDTLKQDLGTFAWRDEDNGAITISGDHSVYQYAKSKSHSVHKDYRHEIVTYTITLQPEGFYPLPYSCVYSAQFSEAFDL